MNSQLNLPIQFHFLTLFPEMFLQVLKSSLLGKAQTNGLVSFHFYQIRDFSTDRHRTVDDNPYGGGEGMLLKADVLFRAWQAAKDFPDTHSLATTHTILLSPQGVSFTQQRAHQLGQFSKIILVCGHYEGVDERFIELCVDEEISIGDYVLTGGELPAMVLVDTVTRLIPGVIGNQRSVHHDSLENGLLKYPQYTRPQEFHGLSVPEVLLSGNHSLVQKWREDQMLSRTQLKRPDLWKKYLSGKDN